MWYSPWPSVTGQSILPSPMRWVSADPWFIATNLLPTRRTLRDYARPFGCEEMFSDLKSRGFHRDLSQLQLPDRFCRLLLAIALLYVWVLSIARRLVFTQAAKSFT